MFPRTRTCVSWCLDVYLLYKWESLQGGRGGVVYLTVLTRCLQMEISCRAVRKAWCWARGGWGHWVRTVVQLRGSSFGFRLLLPESIKAVQQQQWPVTPWEAVSLWGSCVCLFVVLHNCNVSKHGLLSFWCWLSLLMSSMFSWGPTVVLEEAKPAPHQELRLSKQNNWNSLKTPGTSQPS